jgi:predicted glycoside hydrolase/deacetylase ChbG (UPF0249 family)
MIIVNADDWGRSREETDLALECHRAGRLTSVSAMVFMKDSERAADLAQENGVPAGLHLNLNEPYDGRVPSQAVADAHRRIVGFMAKSKYAVLFYHPLLRQSFRDVYNAQLDEFCRLFGTEPVHTDGHQHRHLCPNMLIDGIITPGQRVRRNFTFRRGQKSGVNRAYRRLVDRWLSRRYRLTDYLFNLAQCLDAAELARVFDLAKGAMVELETHPVKKAEYSCLMSDGYFELLSGNHGSSPSWPRPDGCYEGRAAVIAQQTI